MDDDAFRDLLDRRQSGVISARQLHTIDAKPHEVKRLLRRRELTVVHPGVYVDHTGPLTWEQRAFAAVLACWPGALTRESALPQPPTTAPIQVAVDLRRTVRALSGVDVHRTADFQARVQWNRAPPRVRLEHAVIDLATDHLAAGHPTPEAVSDPAAAYRTIADAWQTRQTSPEAIERALAERARVPDRTLLVEMLSDLRTGACSVLEREWLRVETAHGLPAPERQRQVSSGGHRDYRDADHETFGLVIELDGRAFHDTATARDRDAERDLDTAVGSAALTVRLTYGQVFTRGCATARRVGLLLQARGWNGAPTTCAACVDA